MRRGLVIGGIVLLVIGVLMFGGGYALNAAQMTQTATAGQVLELTPTTVGGGTISVSWSNAPSGGTVYFISSSPSSATCTSPSGVVAQGSGASGSFSASVASGTTYSLYACNGATPAGATFAYNFAGLSYLMVIGIVLAVVGLILLAVGARARVADAAPVESAGPGT
ncbi:MAG: hypothetical protein ACREDK_07585 [Thermoplasmata archaeon]